MTSATSTKYATKYDNQTGIDGGNSIAYTVGKIGDGTKEIYRGGQSSSNEKNMNTYGDWFNTRVYYLYSTFPFVLRGAGYSKIRFETGQFSGNKTNGDTFGYRCLRSVLTP